MSAPMIMTIHPIVAQIFQSGLKRWSDQPADSHIKKCMNEKIFTTSPTFLCLTRVSSLIQICVHLACMNTDKSGLWSDTEQ